MSFTPFGPTLGLVATTGQPGFAKVNGTPNILTWTAPADGQPHRFMVFATETVTSAETGGGISTNQTSPSGVQQIGTTNIFSGGKTAGTYHITDGAVIQAGSTVTVLQSAALTAGASTVWVEIWGS
jgi:hypothetical protein